METQLCHVMFFWKLSCERACDVLLECMLERVCDGWKEYRWNPINSERPLMYHGMVPLAAKKDCILLPFLEKASPTKTTPRENSTIVMMSRVVISNDLVNKTGLKNI